MSDVLEAVEVELEFELPQLSKKDVRIEDLDHYIGTSVTQMLWNQIGARRRADSRHLLRTDLARRFIGRRISLAPLISSSNEAGNIAADIRDVRVRGELKPVSRSEP